MKSRLLPTALAAFALAAMTFGCGKKVESLDVAAPPPSQPNAQPETSPLKGRPMAPPTMSGGAQNK
jgi:hypothetical protein